MRALLRFAGLAGGLLLAHIAGAQLVAPPSVDWVSAPSTAAVGQTVNIGVGAHANLSDNSDGNDWNTGQAVVARIMVDLTRPSGSITRIYEWLPTWQTPAEIWTSFTVNESGTHYISVQVMDGRPWYSGTYSYAIGVPNPAPTITSSLSMSVNQGQNVSYTITATNSPTSRNATNLPTGLTVNASTGVISGTIPSNGGTQGSNSTVNSTISATNAVGTDTKTLVWNLTAAAITTSATVSPSSIVQGASVTLTRAATTNFGLAWTENVIWKPDGSAQVLGNLQLGSQSYTPAAPGTYWYQFRVVDTYFNFKDQWISFAVAPAAPASFQSTSVQSTSVALSWSAVGGVAGYNVYRNGVKLNGALITGTTYTDTTAAPGTAYSYTVRSVTATGNESANSSTVNVTTATAGTLVQYTYDASGRLTQAKYVGVSTQNYTLSSASNLTQVSTTQP